MFHGDFPARPHLALRPGFTLDEMEEATEGFDVLGVYAQVGDALSAAIRARPSEAAKISDEFAAFLIALIKRTPDAEELDRFGLTTGLAELPPVILAMTYNHFLCADVVRKTVTIDVPLP